MRKKMLILLVVGSMSCVMIGCQPKRNENYQKMINSQNDILPIYDYDDVENEISDLDNLQEIMSNAVVEEWKNDNIVKPCGIVCLEDGIVVTDSETNSIIKIDYFGNVLKTIDQSGEEKLISPGAIAEYAQKLYVIDQGNNRVQVFDSDLNYIEKIDLKESKLLGPDYQPQTIAVNETGVYVTGMSLHNPVIDWYQKGELQEIGTNFIGSIREYNGQIYAINSMGIYYDEKEDCFGAITTVPGKLMTIKGKKLREVCELPCGFGIRNFLLDEDGIICVSGSGASIYRLDMEGKYIETIASLQGLENEEYPQIAKSDQNEYFLVMPVAKKIYHIFE